MRKLPGPFSPPFWHSLVTQACATEPAVLHAVIALTSAHKNDCSGEGIPTDQEQFILRQYNKAINHLYPHFSSKNGAPILSAKDKASSHVVLVTCVLFVCLEFLRGHYITGMTLFRQGLKLLGDIQPLLDSRIIDAFSGIKMQTGLFGLSSQRLHLESTPPLKFESSNEAKRHLDQLFGIIFEIEKSLQENEHQSCHRQQWLQLQLTSWLRASNAISLNLEMTGQERFSYKVLKIYYIVAKIMAETCFRSASELAYDAYTEDFASIINESTEIITIGRKVATAMWDERVSQNALADVGYIPPLYFVALKCRVHSIRLQAIRLLDSLPHKEGIWDSRLVTRVAQEVTAIEEMGFYSYDDDFASGGLFGDESILERQLPEVNRLHHVQVVLPNDPTDKAILVAKRRLANDCFDSVRREIRIPTLGP